MRLTDKYHGGVPTDHLPPVLTETPIEPLRSVSIEWLNALYPRIIRERCNRFAWALRMCARRLRPPPTESIWWLDKRQKAMHRQLVAQLNGRRFHDPMLGAIAAAAKAVGATMMGEWDLGGGGASENAAVVYVSSSGDDGSDGLSWPTAKASVAAAIAALPSSGGIVQLGAGTFEVASSARTDAGVSYSAGTWTDSHITADDVGSFVLGPNILARTPQILIVNPGVSFTTDVAPTGTVTSESMMIVSPGFVLEEGVQVKGMGSLANTNFTSTVTSATRIADIGTGVTCLIRGGAYAARYGLSQLSIRGSATTSTGNTFCGVFVGNQAWWTTIDACDIALHGTAGLITDSNMNALDVRDTLFLGNGKTSATGPSGGVCTSYFTPTASAGANFYNCLFFVNAGCGICWYTYGTGAGSYGINLHDCQFASTSATSWATYSGYSMVLSGGGLGQANLDGCWSESAANGDIYVVTGPVVATSTTFYSATTTQGVVGSGGVLTTIGCYSDKSSGDVFSNSGTINWMGCQSAGAAWFASGPSSTQLAGVGSSGGITKSGDTSL